MEETVIHTQPGAPPQRVTVWHCPIHGVVRQYEVYDIERSEWVPTEG